MRVTGGVRPTSTFPPPDSLTDLLAATTDADGKGQMHGCRAEDVEAVRVRGGRVRSPGKRAQRRRQTARVITLKAAGRLIGRVQADDPSAARGLEVIAMTRPQAPGGPQTSGEGSATTDAEGRFEIPALAAGKLALNVLPADGSKLRPKLPSDLTIEPGKTTEVTIALEGPPRERTVTGRVVDRDGRPGRQRHRVPVGRFPGANRSRDRRGWAIRIERVSSRGRPSCSHGNRVTASAASPSHPRQQT